MEGILVDRQPFLSKTKLQKGFSPVSDEDEAFLSNLLSSLSTTSTSESKTKVSELMILAF